MLISLSLSIGIVSLAFVAGLILMLAVVCFKKKQLEQVIKNKTQASALNSIELESASREAQLVTHARELPNENSTQLASETKRQVVKIKQEHKQLDLSKVNAKYLNSTRANPLFTNYLHKSNRPFIGY